MTSQQLADCVVPAQATLRDVMLALDRSGTEITLVVDQQQVLIGVMTDGDVRRLLLQGIGLDALAAPHLQKNFTKVAPNAGRGEVVDLMQARTISQIPIVSDRGELLGLHLLREVIGTKRRDNWAVIMAGGRGTRLAPLTDHLPKPMLKVAGRPILERIVLHLVGHGIQRIFLSVNYLGQIIENHFENGARFGARIEYLREQEPLGTGGALSLLPAPPSAPTLVMNGDLVTQADLGSLLDFHERGDQAVSMAVRKYFHTVPFGCVTLEGDRLVEFEEKPTLVRMVNAGIYVLAPHVVADVPKNTSIHLPALAERALARGQLVRVHEIEDDWVDVGQAEQLRRARGEP